MVRSTFLRIFQSLKFSPSIPLLVVLSLSSTAGFSQDSWRNPYNFEEIRSLELNAAAYDDLSDDPCQGFLGGNWRVLEMSCYDRDAPNQAGLSDVPSSGLARTQWMEEFHNSPLVQSNPSFADLSCVIDNPTCRADPTLPQCKYPDFASGFLVRKKYILRIDYRIMYMTEHEYFVYANRDTAEDSAPAIWCGGLRRPRALCTQARTRCIVD